MGDGGYRKKLRLDPPKVRRFITLSEALENVSSSTDHVAVLPPESGDQDMPSDEEDVGDDCVEPAGEIEIFDSDSDDDGPIGNDSRDQARRWSKNVERFDGQPDDINVVCMEDKYPLLVDKTPYEIWRLYFNDDIIKHIVHQTILYARRDQSDMKFQFTENQLLNFLGIVILSGYHSVPSETDYWSNQPDLHVAVVSEAMSRDTFQQIKKYIHLADNQQLTKGDKAAKVQEVYNLLNKSLQQFGMFHANLSVDESMVPYRGRNSMKMYIKGKPIRFGYKLWMLAGADGYPYKLIIYQGKESQQTTEPLGTRVVKSLLQVVEDISTPSDHYLFMDNFFTSYQLLSELRLMQFKATGTVRPNRTGGAAKLQDDDKAMRKAGRGTFDYRTDGTVYIAKWQDNSSVTIGSNHFTHEPLQSTKRRVKRDTLDLTQPNLIKQYNLGKYLLFSSRTVYFFRTRFLPDNRFILRAVLYSRSRIQSIALFMPVHRYFM